MKPIKHEATEDKPKRVRLALGVDGNLLAVDEQGVFVACLITFYEDDVAQSDPGAKYNLRDAGYDTTFTEWDENGAMVLS